MELIAQIAPLDEAVKKFGSRSVVASKLRTAEWEKVPLHLRERALFSAGVEHARFLATAQQKLKDAIAQRREQVARGEAVVDRSSFIGDMRRLAITDGLGTGKGGLTDVAGRARLGLIFDTQLRMAQGYAQRKMDLDPDVLDAFPAQELVREEDRKIPRDWEARWIAAGGQLYGGRMIALKTDPIWTKISRFGTPWPPFDFGSGMGINDISRDEAEQLGLIEPGAPVVADDEYFNRELAASAENVNVDFLKTFFGDQVRIKDGKAEWVGNLIGNLVRDVMAEDEAGRPHKSQEWRGRTLDLGVATTRAIKKAAPHYDLMGSHMQLRPDNIHKLLRDHGPKGEKRKDQRPLTPKDIELLPFVWREPDEIEKGNRGRSLVLKKKLFGEFHVVEWGTKDGKWWAPTTGYVKSEEPGVSPSPKRQGDTSKTTTPDSEKKGTQQ